MSPLLDDNQETIVCGEDGRLVSADAYERFAVCEEGHGWELHHGRLREKPPRSFGYGRTVMALFRRLLDQLDSREDYIVSPGIGRIARGDATYLIPDLHVIPAELYKALFKTPFALDVQRDPLPLVVEVWCPLSGAYQIDEKIPEYLARSDAEVWRLDPFGRHLRAWRRRPDGEYDVVELTGGRVELHALPGVTVDLDALWAPDE